MGSRKTTWVCFWFLVCLFLLIYICSASHTVVIDDIDAAEFQTVGAVGGILHQPYPLWCIIARVFSMLPFGEPAFRITLLSVVFSSLAIGLLFLLLLRRTKHYAASIGAAVALGLSFTYWHFSALAETYSLTIFLFIASLYLVEELWTDESESSALALALLLGLLLSQQTLNIAAVPGLLALILISRRVRRQMFSKRLLIVRVAVFVLPFTLYLYTFLVDRGPHPMNWLDQYGQYVAQAQGVDPSQMETFLGRIRFQMWIGRLNPEMPTLGEYATAVFYWIRHFSSVEYPFVAPVFVFVGFVSLWRQDARSNVFLLALMTPYLVVALSRLGERYAYSLPVYVVCALFLAEGIATAGRAVRGGRVPGRLVPVVIALLVGVMPVLRYAKMSPIAQLLWSEGATAAIEPSKYAFFNLEARNDHGKYYGAKVAEIVEPGSLIFGRWQEANVLFYHKYVNGRLQHVEVSYTLPTWEQIAGTIERRNPKEIYLTHSPEELGLDMFVVKDSHEILPDRILYTVGVRVDDAISP